MIDSLCFAYLYLFKDLRGITRYTVDVCTALHALGRKVSVVCPFRRDHLAETVLGKGINIHYVSHYRYKRLTAVPGFLWFFLTGDFTEVNVSLGFGEAYAAVIAKRIKQGFTYNVLLHMAYEEQYPLFSKLYKRGGEIGLFEGAHKIIAVSNYVRESVKGIIDKERVCVSYNGINRDRFHFDRCLREKKRRDLGADGDEILLLTTSALAWQKNIRNVFPAIRILIDLGIKIRYIIAGCGSKRDKDALNIFIQRNRLERVVLYLGEVIDPLPLYCAADIFILLSQFEAFGISVIEAAACGLPCITSDESAFPEIVDGAIGFMVKRDDTERMVELIMALRDMKKRERFRVTGPERVAGLFDIRKNVSVFL